MFLAEMQVNKMCSVFKQMQNVCAFTAFITVKCI